MLRMRCRYVPELRRECRLRNRMQTLDNVLEENLSVPSDNRRANQIVLARMCQPGGENDGEKMFGSVHRIFAINFWIQSDFSNSQVLNGTVWVDKIRIIQLSEGCGRLKKNSDIVFCHCHGDRCNGARPQSDETTASKTVEEIYATNESTTTTSHSCSTDAMAVIFMFNALKYWRSIADWTNIMDEFQPPHCLQNRMLNCCGLCYSDDNKLWYEHCTMSIAYSYTAPKYRDNYNTDNDFKCKCGI